MVATINTPAFAVTKSADQTISDSSRTTVTFDVEDFDTDAAFASNKFTCPSDKPGLYLFQCELFVQSSNDIDTCQLDLHKNDSANVAGTEIFDITGGEAASTYMARISHIESMAAGDTMECKIFSDIASSGTLNVNQSNSDSDNRTRFHGFRIAGL
jgi:hypothetical protein